MSRLPIRLRLTLSFAISTALVIGLAGIFVYISVSDQLNDAIDETLQTRIDTVAEQFDTEPANKVQIGEVGDPEDSFIQILGLDGRLIDSTSPALDEPVLSGPDPGENAGTGYDVGELPGMDGDVRLLAETVWDQDGRGFIVVAGEATEDRDETLSGLVRTFLVAAPLALLLASLAGYALATAAMRPVGRMRRQASRITLERSGERLPLPTSRDEIHRLGETLNGMLDRIEESLDRERSFVADASHELRTPLAIIRSELELGLRPGRDLASARAAMASAEEEVRHLDGLTGELLALARADGDRISINRSDVSIPALLDDVRGRYGPVAAAEGRTLEMIPRSSGTVSLDRQRIERALGNLVENSLRHGDGVVTCSGRIDGGEAVFTVSDDGAGFPDDFAAQAFERFSRAEAGRTTQGHGLGLAIVKAIAEAHGGSVAVMPTSRGASVEMRVPGKPHS